MPCNAATFNILALTLAQSTTMLLCIIHTIKTCILQCGPQSVTSNSRCSAQRHTYLTHKMESGLSVRARFSHEDWSFIGCTLRVNFIQVSPEKPIRFSLITVFLRLACLFVYLFSHEWTRTRIFHSVRDLSKIGNLSFYGVFWPIEEFDFFPVFVSFVCLSLLCRNVCSRIISGSTSGRICEINVHVCEIVNKLKFYCSRFVWICLPANPNCGV